MWLAALSSVISVLLYFEESIGKKTEKREQLIECSEGLFQYE